MAVCLSVTAGIVSKPILKLFRPSGSPIIEAFGTPILCWYQIPRGTASSGAFNTWGEEGWEKLAIFDGYRRLSRKRCEIYGTLIGIHGCRIEWYNFRWPSVTRTRISRSLLYLKVQYLADGASFQLYKAQLGARPKPCKNWGLCWIFLLKALRCFTPVIEIMPNTSSMKLLRRHTAYQRKVLATTMNALKVKRTTRIAKWRFQGSGKWRKLDIFCSADVIVTTRCVPCVRNVP